MPSHAAAALTILSLLHSAAAVKFPVHKQDTAQHHAAILTRSAQLSEGRHGSSTPEPEAFADSTLQQILHAQSFAAASTSAPTTAKRNGTVTMVEYTDFPSAYYSNVTVGSGAGAQNFYIK